ncbi:MAG: DNA repair protein MmcB-related protein [Alphaproteobacteria bacterium]|nr:MAG: DNA repair protein MmcB-related protein [Alphaproteobacteria bacterium]
MNKPAASDDLPADLTSGLDLPVNERAANVARGVLRLFLQMDIRCVLELPINNGRRIDVAGLDRKGRIIFVEIKSSLNDFRTDSKWPEYLDHCDEFFFAVDTDFPREVLPEDWGLILADRFGAQVVRPSPSQKVHASRRKTVTLDIARAAAGRLQTLLEEDLSP